MKLAHYLLLISATSAQEFLADDNQLDEPTLTADLDLVDT